ncbi:MAG: questin oxidase family protein [Pyrinomonadaceae bacterium]
MIIPENHSAKSLMTVSRRHFVHGLIAGASVYCLTPNLLDGRGVILAQTIGPSSAKQDAAALLDQALEIFARSGPEYGGGLSNHGPMGVEALIKLGRPEAVMPWVEQYKRGLQGPVESRNAISRKDWREALGDINRVGDWIVFFNREMKENPWRTVLRQWIPRLAPGLVGAAAHALIRTSHAVRSLEERETEIRRQELVQGLAYWAARYTRLPMSPKHKSAGLKPSQAITQVKTLPVEQRAGDGLITPRLRPLDEFSPFENVTNLVDSAGNPSQFISDLTATFAGVYLANAKNSTSSFALLHAVTGASAVRLLLPYVKPEATRDLLRYAWQAVAALYAAFGSIPVPDALDNRPQNKEDLIDRAVAKLTRDVHAVKLTEVCLREYELNPNPVYLLAARQ